MSSQITTTVSIVMVILFSIAIIGFSIGFATDNDAVMSIADDAELSSFNTDTRTDMTTFQTDANDTYQSIIETTVEPGSDVVQSSAPFALTVGNFVGVFKNVVMLPYKKIFGSGDGFGIFFTTFLAFLVFVIGLLIYKTWKGNP